MPALCRTDHRYVSATESKWNSFSKQHPEQVTIVSPSAQLLLFCKTASPGMQIPLHLCLRLRLYRETPCSPDHLQLSRSMAERNIHDAQQCHNSKRRKYLEIITIEIVSMASFPVHSCPLVPQPSELSTPVES